MAQKVSALIVKQKYSPHGKNPYWLAELTLLDYAGKEFVGSPRRFPEFQAVADLLTREAGVTYEELQNAKAIFDAGEVPAKVNLTLERENRTVFPGLKKHSSSSSYV